MQWTQNLTLHTKNWWKHNKIRENIMIIIIQISSRLDFIFCVIFFLSVSTSWVCESMDASSLDICTKLAYEIAQRLTSSSAVRKRYLCYCRNPCIIFHLSSSPMNLKQLRKSSWGVTDCGSPSKLGLSSKRGPASHTLWASLEAGKESAHAGNSWFNSCVIFLEDPLEKG